MTNPNLRNPLVKNPNLRNAHMSLSMDLFHTQLLRTLSVQTLKSSYRITLLLSNQSLIRTKTMPFKPLKLKYLKNSNCMLLLEGHRRPLCH